MVAVEMDSRKTPGKLAKPNGFFKILVPTYYYH